MFAKGAVENTHTVLRASPEPVSETASPKSSEKRASSRRPENGQRLAGNVSKPEVILKWGLRNSVTRPNPGYNKGTIRGEMWLLKTHRSRGAMTCFVRTVNGATAF